MYTFESEISCAKNHQGICFFYCACYYHYRISGTEHDETFMSAKHQIDERHAEGIHFFHVYTTITFICIITFRYEGVYTLTQAAQKLGSNTLRLTYV